jgi:hypothetical protein
VAFSIQDFHDLVRLLDQHPEWRAELRRLVLTEELLGLPAVVRELADAQRRTEAELRELARGQSELRQIVAGLVDAQRQIEGELRELRQIVAELAEAQRRTEEELRELARGQSELHRDLDDVRDQLGILRGRDLERWYREHAGAYFDDLVRRPRLLSPQQLADLLDAAEDAGQLTAAERRDILLADLVVRGRRIPDGSEVFLVVEVSVGIGPEDVERAVRRARLLDRLAPALAAVAGERIMPEAAALAEARGVWRVLDGRATAPGEG